MVGPNLNPAVFKFLKKNKIIILICLIVLSLPLINLTYQFYQKPSEFVGLFQGPHSKSLLQTWKTYENDFRAHSTDVLDPFLLAALAQAESNGNPLVTTYWRWNFKDGWGRIFAPASTAAGLMQITAPTFEDAKRFCIHNGKVVLEGPLWDFNTCWFNGFYFRNSASHSIEMTSARLKYYVAKYLNSAKKVELIRKQELALVIHLCGTGKGRRFVKNNFDFKKINPCGDHNPKRFVAKVFRFKKLLEKKIN